MPKLCSKCNRILEESNFNWKIKDVRLAVHCKECSRDYIREHYYKNREYYLNKAKRRNLAYKKIVYKFLGDFFYTHPCVDCGETDILVLEFDHIDRGKKTNNMSALIKKGWSINGIRKEIENCDVRCVNCHRRKTEKESNSWKLKYARL
jgi:hypothetical protein